MSEATKPTTRAELFAVARDLGQELKEQSIRLVTAEAQLTRALEALGELVATNLPAQNGNRYTGHGSIWHDCVDVLVEHGRAQWVHDEPDDDGDVAYLLPGDKSWTDEPTMCPHGRPGGQMCPHCLGLNETVEVDDDTTHDDLRKWLGDHGPQQKFRLEIKNCDDGRMEIRFVPIREEG